MHNYDIYKTRMEVLDWFEKDMLQSKALDTAFYAKEDDMVIACMMQAVADKKLEYAKQCSDDITNSYKELYQKNTETQQSVGIVVNLKNSIKALLDFHDEITSEERKDCLSQIIDKANVFINSKYQSENYSDNVIPLIKETNTQQAAI